MPQILSISIPSTFVAMLLASAVMYRHGKELEDDPVFQQRVAAGEVEDIPEYVRLSWRARREKISVQELVEREGIVDVEIPDEADIARIEQEKDDERVAAAERSNGARPGSGRLSAIVFMVTVVAVIVLGSFPSLRPLDADGATLSMSVLIQIIMLACSAVILVVTKVRVASIPGMSIAKTGLVAVVSIFGLAWLGSTVIDAHPHAAGGLAGHLHPDARGDVAGRQRRLRAAHVPDRGGRPPGDGRPPHHPPDTRGQDRHGHR